jgi:predicted secreted protein
VARTSGAARPYKTRRSATWESCGAGGQRQTLGFTPILNRGVPGSPPGCGKSDHHSRGSTICALWCFLTLAWLSISVAKGRTGRMTEIPTNLDMSVGEQRDVELPGLGTAGYAWDSEIAGQDDGIDVHWTRGDPPGSPPRPVGQSAPEVATIRAVAPGDVDLRLYQHRRWEPASQAIARHDIRVHVRPV